MSPLLDLNNYATKLRVRMFNELLLFVQDRWQMESLFTKVYRSNKWQGLQSVSGRGSDPDQTAVLRNELPVFLDSYNIRSVLDAPCGDFLWMKETKLNLSQYIGADLVEELIIENQTKYGDYVRSFIQLNIAKDPSPQVDLILCRDCLVHLSNRNIHSALKNFRRSNSTYLLTTTFTEITENHEIATGDWRALNLELPPFNFPKPMALLNEKCPVITDRNYSDKCLGLWRLKDLTL